MLGSGIIIFIKSKVLGIPKNEFDKYPMLAIVGAFFLGIILKLFRITKPDPLRGTLEGFLSFEPDRIVAGEMIFKMEEIKHVGLPMTTITAKAPAQAEALIQASPTVLIMFAK